MLLQNAGMLREAGTGRCGGHMSWHVCAGTASGSMSSQSDVAVTEAGSSSSIRTTNTPSCLTWQVCVYTSTRSSSC